MKWTCPDCSPRSSVTTPARCPRCCGYTDQHAANTRRLIDAEVRVAEVAS